MIHNDAVVFFKDIVGASVFIVDNENQSLLYFCEKNRKN